MISGVREWFRWYKAPDGKPLNEFACEGACLGRDRALEIVDETHEFWRRMRAETVA